MNVIRFIILMTAVSTALRLVLGRRNPIVLLPLIVASAAGFADVQGSWLQWPYLLVGITITVAAMWLTVEQVKSTKPTEQ